MNLYDLTRLLEHYQGAERDDAEVVLMDRRGERLPVLSMSWDAERGHWVLVGDIDA